MSAKLPDGATVSIATAYAAVKNITTMSNAAPPVAGAAAHGLNTNDLLVLKSGWQELNDRVVRATATGVDAFSVQGADATDQLRFPAGGGIGSFRKINTWQQVTQILGFETTGGDQQYANFSFLEEDFERQLPTVTSAQSINLTIADDATLPGYKALKAVSDARAVTAIRLALRDGSVILYNGIIALNETPTLTKGQVMAVRASISLQSRPVRYDPV